MHFSAKRGLAIACRLSVCLLSVTLVDFDHIGWNPLKIISLSVWLGCSLFATQTSWIYSRGATGNLGPKWPTSCWFERRRHSIANCGRIVTDSPTLLLKFTIDSYSKALLPSSVVNNEQRSDFVGQIFLYFPFNVSIINAAAVSGDSDDSGVVATGWWRRIRFILVAVAAASAVNHDASVWAPIVWSGSLPPGTAYNYKLRCRVHTLIRLSLSILHFFFGRRIWRPFPYYSFYWCVYNPLTPRPRLHIQLFCFPFPRFPPLLLMPRPRFPLSRYQRPYTKLIMMSVFQQSALYPAYCIQAHQ